jgi:YaiO family outer membrane protein
LERFESYFIIMRTQSIALSFRQSLLHTITLQSRIIMRCNSVGFLALVLLLNSPIIAQSTVGKTQPDTGAVDAASTPVAKVEDNAAIVKQPKFHLEIGGFYSPFIPGSGSLNWRGWDTRLTYTGIKRLAPFGGISRISTGKGSQNAYGLGSYVTFNKWFYTIGGASFAPTMDTEFSPHRRYDIAGFYAVPKVKGMLVTTGFTVLPAYKNSGGGRILALGDIYYWRKFIFSGNASINFAYPGNRRSVSGQFSVNYGLQGKYYIAGGMSGGGTAYMLVVDEPFEVRYQTVGAFLIMTKWIAPHSNINFRYDYSTIIDSNAERHSFRTGLSYEF